MALSLIEALTKPFVWGDNGAALTPEELAKMRDREDQAAQQGVDFSPVGSWTQGLARVANAAAGSFRRGQLADAQKASDAYNSNLIASLLGGGASAPDLTMGGGNVSAAPSAGQDQIRAAAGLTGTQASRGAPGSVFSPFMATIKSGGITNPNALAAIAATGMAESGFSPDRANSTWSDPSQSGSPGTSGGVMSWRNDRLNNLLAFAGQRGEKPGSISPETQAAFFLQENPQLTDALNKAETPEQAQALMNNAWKFAGYDQPGGETARRQALALQFAPQFSTPGGATTEAPVQVAQATPTTMSDASPSSVAAPYQPPATTASGMNPALIKALSDPRLNSSSRGVIQLLVQQQMQQDAAAREESSWRGRQDYENQLRTSDPAYKLGLQKAERDLATPNLINAGNGALYDPVKGQWITAPPGVAGGPESFFGNPIAVQNPDGSVSYGQISNKGTFKPIQLGQGQSFAPPTKTIDAGTENLIMDQAGNVVARVPKNVGGVASETAQGKAQGEAVAALPQVEQAAQNMLTTIDSLDKDPYLGRMLGPVDSRLPNLSSDSARVQSKMDQIKGQSFLQAYNALKGAGQITEIEGQKATEAMSRLNTAQSEDDFHAALAELRGIVQSGLERSRQKAGGSTTQSQQRGTIGLGQAMPSSTGSVSGYTIKEVP